jgi:hypothetical protein
MTTALINLFYTGNVSLFCEIGTELLYHISINVLRTEVRVHCMEKFVSSTSQQGRLRFHFGV